MLATQAWGPECLCNTQCKVHLLPRVSELSWRRQGSKLIAKLGELVDSGFSGDAASINKVECDQTRSYFNFWSHTHTHTLNSNGHDALSIKLSIRVGRVE